ncbi:MAG: DNA alkylation repair protein [Gammaproteobacteria bacterium]|nr:DNA alkylation repair protein [Gammaproteobacteria bacterium]
MSKTEVKTPVLMRDGISEVSVHALALRLKSNWKPFNIGQFEQLILPPLPDLGLSERIQLVRQALKEALPDDFRKAVSIMVDSLGPEIPEHGLENIDVAGPNGFIVMSQTAYVARYGLEYFDLSMAAFYQMTRRFSAEGSIRYFILQHEQQTLKQLDSWVHDDNFHVRRLVSECTRPRLPWMIRLPEYVDNPAPVLKLLNKLKEDPSLYVRRSVANNLNDIAKDNPALVTATLQRWNKKPPSKEMAWLTRHALRTLVKQGNPEALTLLGYPQSIKLSVEQFRAGPKRLVLGNELKLRIKLVSSEKKPVPLMIDFVLHHMKANGKLRPKVFKLAKKMIAPGEVLTIEKRHPMRPITTRKYYSGRHEVELQVNGKIIASDSFNLQV